jgi:hypothetical protein
LEYCTQDMTVGFPGKLTCLEDLGADGPAGRRRYVFSVRFAGSGKKGTI